MNKQVFRSKKNRIIGGVAGGLGEYFEIDPVIFRIIFVISLFAWGAPIFIYLVLWMIIPENKEQAEYYYNYDEDRNESEEFASKHKNKNLALGIILIFLGFMIFLNNVLPTFDFHYFWPLFLILFGAYIIYRGINRHHQHPHHHHRYGGSNEAN